MAAATAGPAARSGESSSAVGGAAFRGAIVAVGLFGGTPLVYCRHEVADLPAPTGRAVQEQPGGTPQVVLTDGSGLHPRPELLVIVQHPAKSGQRGRRQLREPHEWTERLGHRHRRAELRTDVGDVPGKFQRGGNQLVGHPRFGR